MTAVVSTYAILKALKTEKGLESPKTLKRWSAFLISALITGLSIMIHVNTYKSLTFTNVEEFSVNI